MNGELKKIENDSVGVVCLSEFIMEQRNGNWIWSRYLTENLMTRNWKCLFTFSSVLLILGMIFIFWPNQQSPLTFHKDLIQYRDKGTFQLSIFSDAQKGGKRLVPGESVVPGGRIRFAISTKQGGFLTIVGIDETRKVFLYYPSRPDLFHLIKPGLEQLLLGAIRLDDTGGTEWVVALLCQKKLSFRQIERAISVRVGGIINWKTQGVEQFFPGQCQQSSLYLLKKGREL